MNQRKVCVSFNGLCGSLCDCGQSCEPAPEQAGGSRVLRAYFDKAGQYDWTAPDIRNGLSYPALVRLKGSGAGGESAFRAGCTYGGVGGGEGCLVECEFMLVPGRTYHLTVGKGGAGGVISPETGYTGNVASAKGAKGENTVFDELCAAPGAPGQRGGNRSLAADSSEIVTPGQPGGASVTGCNMTCQVQGGSGGGQGGSVTASQAGVHGGGGGGGTCIHGDSASLVTFTAGMDGGDGFIAIYSR